LIYGNKKVKKLVIHPQKKPDLKKVKSEDNIKLTKQVIKKVRNTQVKPKKMNNIGRAKSPTNEEMRKKKKEMNYFYDDLKKMQKQNTVTKNRKRNFEAKNEYNLKKILNVI
jgi:anion-transporting  ArsA/GET3 family ATPase